MSTPARTNHPGLHLQERYLTPLGVTAQELADVIGCPQEEIVTLLSARSPVTLALALQLARAVGGTPEHWLALQSAYDVAEAAPLPSPGASWRPLESSYWGKPVAVFTQKIRWHGDEEVRCIVICTYSHEGHPAFVFVQSERHQEPSLVMCVEHHAIAALNVMKRGPRQEDICFVDQVGFAYFRARCEQARQAAVQGGNATLQGVKDAGNVAWAIHYLRGTDVWSGEAAGPVWFVHENVPTFGNNVDGKNVGQLLGQETRNLGHQYGRMRPCD